MAFRKTIKIDVPPNLDGPRTWDCIKIAMVFDQGAISSSEPFTPVIWRASTVLLRQPDQQHISITYTADTAVSKAQLEDGNIVQSELDVRLGAGEGTALLLQAGTPTFTTPTGCFLPEVFGIYNELTTSPNIAAGLYDGAVVPNFSPIAVLKSVPVKKDVRFGFNPNLSIYSLADFYQESQLLPGQLSNFLWTHNLNDPNLPHSVRLILVWQPEKGDYQLISA